MHAHGPEFGREHRPGFVMQQLEIPLRGGGNIGDDHRQHRRGDQHHAARRLATEELTQRRDAAGTRHAGGQGWVCHPKRVTAGGVAAKPLTTRIMVETAPHHALLDWWRTHAVAEVEHQDVNERVHEDAGWSSRYLFNTAMSAGIAILGLLLSSPAVVIGAMLISPLMGPIIGLGFSLATADAHQIKRAGVALFAGSLFAILFCAALVLISPLQNVTSEIAARTRPNLFDLVVALFSALAGSYATIRGRAGDHCGRRHRHRVDAAARDHRVRAGDVERHGVFRRAAAVRHQLRHDRADRGGDGTALWLWPAAVAASDGAAERRDPDHARGACGAAGAVATPHRVREFRQQLRPRCGGRGVRQTGACQSARYRFPMRIRSS